MVNEILFDVRQAAAVLHVSVSLVHHMTSKREIDFLKLGKKIFFTTADLDSYMLSRRVESSAIGKSDTSKAPAASPSRRRAAAGRASRASAGAS
jgi:excisionase family DNA binding protein